MALELDPDHLSCYALQLALAPDEWAAPPRPGALRWRNRLALQQDDGLASDQYRLAEEVLAAAGYRHYELSSWARPGRESAAQLGLLGAVARTPGIGAGAHSYDGAAERSWNVRRARSATSALPRRGSVRWPIARCSTERRARSRPSPWGCGGSTGSIAMHSRRSSAPTRWTRMRPRRTASALLEMGRRPPPAHAARPPLRLRGLPRVPAGAGRLMLFPPATLQAIADGSVTLALSPMGPTARARPAGGNVRRSA